MSQFRVVLNLSSFFIRVVLGFVFDRQREQFNQKFAEFYDNLCNKTAHQLN